jgi:hypothetical protein
MLASLISGKWKEGDGESEIFIDRDGGRFKYVLDYLRSDRVSVIDRLDRAALQEEFDYFGIDADTSKIFMMDDFLSIDALAKEIKAYEAVIEEKKKTIAVIQESYRFAGKFATAVDLNGTCLKFELEKDVDKELIRGCLLSRGLSVVSYGIKSKMYLL